MYPVAGLQRGHIRNQKAELYEPALRGNGVHSRTDDDGAADHDLCARTSAHGPSRLPSLASLHGQATASKDGLSSSRGLPVLGATGLSTFFAPAPGEDRQVTRTRSGSARRLLFEELLMKQRKVTPG